MNGFEATEYIRNTLKLQIPIVALTADVTTVDLAKCKAVGMNDYIAKPVDESLLYYKITEFVKKVEPTFVEIDQHAENFLDEEPFKIPAQKQAMAVKCINLEYLIRRTKSNPKLMIEMISLYLMQTRPLVSAMKKSLQDSNWDLLQAVAHKMIPSFSIIGINPCFEDIAKEVQEYARQKCETVNSGTMQQTNFSFQTGNDIHVLVSKLENVCEQACRELEEELITINEHSPLKA